MSLLKTEGDLCAESSAIADKLWPAELLIAVTFLIATAFVAKLYDNLLSPLVPPK